MSNQGGWQTIGKAVKKGTKQVERTLADIIESPGERGMGRMAKLQSSHLHQDGDQTGNHRLPHFATKNLGLDTGVSLVKLCFAFEINVFSQYMLMQCSLM